jgi:hypothetical protein
MDRIRIRTHKELSGVTEKYMGFSFKQWFFILLALAITLPFYFYARNYLGEELTSWIVIFVGAPIMLCGFLEVQGLTFARLVPFLFRHYLDFAKPLEYKTQEQLEREKWERSREGKKELKKQRKREEKMLTDQAKAIQRKGKSESADGEFLSKKELRQMKKSLKKEVRQKRKMQKIQREQTRQLARAHEKYASYEWDGPQIMKEELDV